MKKVENPSLINNYFLKKKELSDFDLEEKNISAPPEDSISSDEYGFLEYVEIKLWSSFYYQIAEIMTIAQKTDSILEVGKGTGILGGVLKEFGFSYESLDINPNLRPVHIGSADNLPFRNESFGLTCCFEVLEHLPYEKFSDSLNELFRVSNKAVIISLPNAKKIIPFYFWIPKIFRRKVFLPLPFYNPNNHITDPAHHWEINRAKLSFVEVKRTLSECANKFGFRLERNYRFWENPYHHIFVFYKY